jgi:hypothetical protein
VVSICGVLFEDWITESGSYTSRRESRRLRKLSIKEERLVAMKEMRVVSARERVPFWAATLIACNHLGTKVRQQIFYVHLLVKFRELLETNVWEVLPDLSSLLDETSEPIPFMFLYSKEYLWAVGHILSIEEDDDSIVLGRTHVVLFVGDDDNIAIRLEPAFYGWCNSMAQQWVLLSEDGR